MYCENSNRTYVVESTTRIIMILSSKQSDNKMYNYAHKINNLQEMQKKEHDGKNMLWCIKVL